MRYHYLALSGTIHGVTAASASGTDVATHNILQSAKKYAIHGNKHAAMVKNKAMDMLATNVRHFGPTYSNTANTNTPYLCDFGAI